MRLRRRRRRAGRPAAARCGRRQTAQRRRRAAASARRPRRPRRPHAHPSRSRFRTQHLALLASRPPASPARASTTSAGRAGDELLVAELLLLRLDAARRAARPRRRAGRTRGPRRWRRRAARRRRCRRTAPRGRRPARGSPPATSSESLASRTMVPRSALERGGRRPAVLAHERAHRLARLHAVLGADAADGADQLLHQPELARAPRRPRPARSGRGHGATEIDAVRRPAGEPPPERLGDERHDRVQQPERHVEGLRPRPPGRRRRPGCVAVEPGLDLLDVPVGQVAPEEAVDRARRPR